jgi:hypothetical protein
MLQKSVVMTAVWLEIVVGAIFLTVPDVPCRLLFAAKPEGVGVVLARFAGVGLFALGIACLPSTATGSHRNAVFGLIVFNVGVASLFAWVGVATTLRGELLWPVVVLHAAIALALLPQLFTYKLRLSIGGEERVGKGLG